MAENKDMACLA